jgi:protein-S-isoprenylcysteine O-methyltransferase Ste14
MQAQVDAAAQRYETALQKYPLILGWRFPRFRSSRRSTACLPPPNRELKLMGSASERLVVLIRGAVMATLFVSLWVWLASLVRRLDPFTGVALPEWLRAPGWLLGLAGGAMGLTCVFLFLTTGRGTPAPFDPPRVFVAAGPYRYVRNPMYVGGVLALAGAGLVVRSISILALAVLFWGLSHLVVVLNEEPALEKRFGDSFLRYKRQVHRWRPRRPSEERDA